MNEGIERTPDMPHLGESGHFCIELFCGSGNLTYAMKHFFPDSFGVDHKVSKQRVKTILFGFKLAEESATSGTVVPFRSMSVGPIGAFPAEQHPVPVFVDSAGALTDPHLCEQIVGRMAYLHYQAWNLRRVRLANSLYAFMAHLIPKLSTHNIVWTVRILGQVFFENILLEIVERFKPWYCELHNCMFGGARLKRTCIASNTSAVMSLAIHCDGQHSACPLVGAAGCVRYFS